MKLPKCLAVAAICVTSACRTDVQAPDTAASLCAASVAARAEVGGTTPDDLFEVMARVLPGGFGGIGNGVFLKHPELAESMHAAARTLAACPGEPLTNLWTVAQFSQVRRGDYDWIELRQWYKQLLNNAVVAGMTTADMSEGTNRLAFTFSNDAALAAFRDRAQQLGVPLGALSLSILVIIPIKPTADLHQLGDGERID